MSRINNPQTLPMLGLLIGCILFGMGSLIVVHVDVGAYAMAFWRLAVSSIVFVLLALLFRQKFPRSKPALVYALLAGAALGLDLALWHESIHAVGPGISTLLNSLQIFFLAFIGFCFFGERQNRMQLVSLVLAVMGVALIASPEFGHNGQAGLGFVTGIVSGACLAISLTWVRQVHYHAPTPLFSLMALVGAGGAMAVLPLMLWLDQGQILPKTPHELGWILVYGTVMQCLAFGAIAFSIPRLSLAVTGLLLLSEPVAALVLDYFWLNKSITAIQWLGAALTMAAIYLGSVKAKAKH